MGELLLILTVVCITLSIAVFAKTMDDNRWSKQKKKKKKKKN
jgi:hypothetical protein